MKKAAGLVLCTVIALAASESAARAQIKLQPTPAPTVTAETENWYQTGEPIVFAGNYYYPAGPAIHFLANEMVPTGSYRGVQLYSRTTIEPYSIVFVPLAGGLMQPYERRRAGDLAGTTGSSVPSFPVEIPSAFGAPPPIQAAGPPFVETQMSNEYVARPQTALGVEPPLVSGAPSSSSVGTIGRLSAAPRPKPVGPPSANGIFVEFDHARWYASAPPKDLDSASLRRIGEWHGFPVYATRSTGESTIYIPVTQGSDAYAAYSKKK
jgi:hypothetical protein